MALYLSIVVIFYLINACLGITQFSNTPLYVANDCLYDKDNMNTIHSGFLGNATSLSNNLSSPTQSNGSPWNWLTGFLEISAQATEKFVAFITLQSVTAIIENLSFCDESLNRVDAPAVWGWIKTGIFGLFAVLLAILILYFVTGRNTTIS